MGKSNCSVVPPTQLFLFRKGGCDLSDNIVCTLVCISAALSLKLPRLALETDFCAAVQTLESFLEE